MQILEGLVSQGVSRALDFAIQEAEAFDPGHGVITIELIVLGLMLATDGSAAQVLANLGVELPKVREAVKARIGSGKSVASGEIRFQRSASRVLKDARKEANRLGHRRVHTLDLLIAILRKQDRMRARVRKALGVTLQDVLPEANRVLAPS